MSLICLDAQRDHHDGTPIITVVCDDDDKAMIANLDQKYATRIIFCDMAIIPILHQLSDFNSYPTQP
eukprot:scaffold11002_cov59-Attheya_sp.AAC.2